MKSGIVLYNIELHGCLNGVYTNDGSDGEIYNEIASMSVKKPGTDDLCGEYLCTFFETGNKQVSCKLFVDIKAGTTSTYTFSWEENGKVIFDGIGYLMNEKQIAVHYKPVK